MKILFFWMASLALRAAVAESGDPSVCGRMNGTTSSAVGTDYSHLCLMAYRDEDGSFETGSLVLTNGIDFDSKNFISLPFSISATKSSSGQFLIEGRSVTDNSFGFSGTLTAAGGPLLFAQPTNLNIALKDIGAGGEARIEVTQFDEKPRSNEDRISSAQDLPAP